VNVNTASEPVLAYPGIGIEHASSLVGYRLSADKLNTLAWVKDAGGHQRHPPVLPHRPPGKLATSRRWGNMVAATSV
jgi:hypothetical protein